MEFRPLSDLLCRVGESPVWDERRKALFICDIPGPSLHLIDLEGTIRGTWSFNAPVASVGLADSGRIVITLGRDVVVFDPDNGSMNLLARTPEPETNRLNDGKVGPDGRFYVGGMDTSPQKDSIASLYRVSADGSVERLVQGLQISNGLAWSPDGKRMYHSDTRGPWIDCYSFDPEQGSISGRRRFADLNDVTGKPDGGACDQDGNYWCAGVTAGALNLFSQDGELLASHPLPLRAPTMPCFCGPDLNLMIITSISDGLPDLQPNSLDGRVLIGPAPAAGVPVTRMRDI